MRSNIGLSIALAVALAAACSPAERDENDGSPSDAGEQRSDAGEKGTDAGEGGTDGGLETTRACFGVDGLRRDQLDWVVEPKQARSAGHGVRFVGVTETYLHYLDEDGELIRVALEGGAQATGLKPRLVLTRAHDALALTTDDSETYALRKIPLDGSATSTVTTFEPQAYPRGLLPDDDGVLLASYDYENGDFSKPATVTFTRLAPDGALSLVAKAKVEGEPARLDSLGFARLGDTVFLDEYSNHSYGIRRIPLDGTAATALDLPGEDVSLIGRSDDAILTVSHSATNLPGVYDVVVSLLPGGTAPGEIVSLEDGKKPLGGLKPIWSPAPDGHLFFLAGGLHHLSTDGDEASLVACLDSSLDVRSLAGSGAAVYLIVMTEQAELGVARVALP